MQQNTKQPQPKTTSAPKTVGTVIFSGITYIGTLLLAKTAIAKLTETRTPDEEFKTFLFSGIFIAIIIFYLLIIFAAGFFALRLAGKNASPNKTLLKTALTISFIAALIIGYYSTIFSL